MTGQCTHTLYKPDVRVQRPLRLVKQGQNGGPWYCHQPGKTTVLFNVVPEWAALTYDSLGLGEAVTDRTMSVRSSDLRVSILSWPAARDRSPASTNGSTGQECPALTSGLTVSHETCCIINWRHAERSYDMNGKDWRMKCCFTSTVTVDLLGTGAQDVCFEFHTAPELWNKDFLFVSRFGLAVRR